MPEEISNLNYSSNKISGLASGMETEKMIESLMKAEREKVVRIEQEKAYALWQQEAYREIIDKLSDFTKTYFNLADNSKNILSSGNLKTTNLEQNDYLSVLVNADARSGAFSINEIVQLAKSAYVQGQEGVKRGIRGDLDLSNISEFNLEGFSFNLRLDGEQHQVTFENNYNQVEDFIEDLQVKLDKLFGDNRIEVGLSSENTLILDAKNSSLQILEHGESTEKLDFLGLKNGDTNILNLKASVADLSGKQEDIRFEINGVEFSFSHEDSIDKIFKAINKSQAGVRVDYDSIKDQVSFTASKTGSNSEISIKNIEGDFFGASGMIKIQEGDFRNGQDAIFYLNDSDKSSMITRSNNTFTIDNITYTLKKETKEEINFEITNNTEGAYKSIKAFVDDYNLLIKELNNQLSQKRDYNYKPLSEEQKAGMSEKQIKDWEAKAKEGILKSEPLFTSLLNELKMAFIYQIEDQVGSFKQMGLSLNNDRSGEILLNENLLKASLEENFEDTMAMFKKESQIDYSRDISGEMAKKRYDQSGFFQRVNDIIKKYITSTRDKQGFKGLLLEKAGILNDSTQNDNALSKKINEIQKRIDKANETKDKKEKEYWKQFSSMEVAINKMNSQSNFISMMMGE